MNYQGPGRYKHYQGGEYKILGLAWDENADYRLVIYQTIDSRSNCEAPPISFWVRKLENFNELEDGKPRFEILESI